MKFVTRVFIAFLVTCQIMGAVSAVVVTAQEDLSGHTAMVQLISDGIVTGDGSGGYSPSREITLAEALVILERMMGSAEKLPSMWSEEAWRTAYADSQWGSSGFTGSKISYDTAAAMILDYKGIGVLPLRIYGLDEKGFEGSLSSKTLKVYGYTPPVSSGSDCVSRANFCDMVLWAHRFLSKYVPQPVLLSDLKIENKTGKTGYELELENAHIAEAFSYIPDSMLVRFIESGSVVEFYTKQGYAEAVSNSESEAVRSSIALFRWGSKDARGVILTYDLNVWTFTHEFAHYIHYTNWDKDSVIKLLFADSSEVFGLERTTGNAYCRGNDQEFFAEAFAMYVVRPVVLAKECPKTYAFIESLVDMYDNGYIGVPKAPVYKT